MSTLLLSTFRLPAAEALTHAARRRGWKVFGLDQQPEPPITVPAVFYGGTDVADSVAARFDLALIEPSFDLLVKTPYAFRLRTVEYGDYDALRPFASPRFIKPADPRRKAFDAGIYRDVRDARLESALDPQMPVLVAEPVEWLEEYRCFILKGEIVASSPYLRFGRPVWQPFDRRSGAVPLRCEVAELCRRLLSIPDVTFPPAFVLDVGFVEGRGWAVVEYNPAWCSSLLGCDPAPVLTVLERAGGSWESIRPKDRAWMRRHPAEPGKTPSPRSRPEEPVWSGAHAGAMT